MKELSVNHLIGIKYITKEDIDLIFETFDHFNPKLSIVQSKSTIFT